MPFTIHRVVNHLLMVVDFPILQLTSRGYIFVNSECNYLSIRSSVPFHFSFVFDPP